MLNKTITIEEVLQPLFDKVFNKAPKSGQYNYRTHPVWKEFYKALCNEKETIRGVVIARSVNTGVWFPSYHYNDFKGDYEELYVEGSAMRSYIEIK